MITDFTSLQTAIRERLTHAQLDGSALDVPIQMGQQRLEDDLATAGHSVRLDVVFEGAFVAGESAIALPANLLEMRAFYVADDDDVYRLVVPTSRELQGLETSIEGIPEKRYMQGNTIVVAPVPDKAYAFRLEYVGSPAILSTGNPTNWYIEKAANALFYSCLMEAAAAMRETESVEIYKAPYQRAIDGLITKISREKYGDMPPQMVTGYQV